MGSFTITAVGGFTFNAFFIPNAAGCATELTPVGEANNWECVDDPRITPDEDATYVHSDATNLKYDLYEIPNHTTESGTINYIQIYGRAKSHSIAQHEDGIFKLILTDNDCTNIYKSDDINLTTTYATYDNIWTTNPRTLNALTWDDIDNLQIGEECNSPAVSHQTLYLTIRPNADSAPQELSTGCDLPYCDGLPCPNGIAADYIDETTMDEYCTYLYNDVIPSAKYSLFDLTNHTAETGAITNVAIFICANPRDGAVSYARTVLKTHATVYYGDYGAELARNNWNYRSTNYPLNPNTNNAWTWAEIDDLLGGVDLKTTTEGHEDTCFCTQIYVVITHIAVEGFSPEIRTTQCYLKVNYTKSVSCTLDKPEEISVDHDQNIKMLNFWSGRRAVYGLSRNKRTMVMIGKLYSDTACTTIECVRELAEADINISISGLNDYNYDKIFKILSFGWEKISDSPLAYNWILECEYTT